jgi:hypothetical protein
MAIAVATITNASTGTSGPVKESNAKAKLRNRSAQILAVRIKDSF